MKSFFEMISELSSRNQCNKWLNINKSEKVDWLLIPENDDDDTNNLKRLVNKINWLSNSVIDSD